MLAHDTSRCQGKYDSGRACEYRNTCARYVERNNRGPQTYDLKPCPENGSKFFYIGVNAP